MMTNIFIKINNDLYPAEIEGNLQNCNWDNRETKSITLQMSYEKGVKLFVDGLKWSIVMKTHQDDDVYTEEFNNDDYDLAGDIIDHRDGTITVIMGKSTDLENAYAIMMMDGE